MGIQQTKSLLKTYYSVKNSKDPDSYLEKAFCAESLQLQEFLENFWDPAALEHFDWTNIQENKKLEEIQKEKDKFFLVEKYLIPELPDTNIIKNNIFSIENFCENKEAYNPEDTKKFSENFIKSMNVILFAHIKKIISTSNESSSIECISKYFEMSSPEEKMTNDYAMNLLVKMLEDQTINQNNKKLKAETLDILSQNLIFIRPLNFFMESKIYFEMDKSLDQLVNYLKKIVSDASEEKYLRIKAYKIILNLALAKGSLKNLLDFIKYYDYLDEFIDLNNEINIFKNEFIKLSLSRPTNQGVICKTKLWDFRLSENSKKKKESNEEANFSITTDGNYVYLFNSIGYLLKIGTGYNNTMLGKVYLIKENFHVGEKATIVLVENILYLRSPELDPNPLECIDAENFNLLQINYDINIREPNHLWVEGKKNDFEFPHNSHKDMNEIIEKKKNKGAEDKPNQRPSSRSPLLTDGRYIYVLSKWFDDYDNNNIQEKSADDDDDEPKNLNKKPINSIFGVDVYDPLNNMSVVKSVKLNTDEENKKLAKEQKNNNLIDLLTEKVEYKDSKTNKNENCSNLIYTNGNIIVIGNYKFNLNTGELIENGALDHVKELKTVCYDLANNVIWGITCASDKLQLISYFNHSAKPIIEFPSSHVKYMPCSMEKIINFSEEKIKLENLLEKTSVKTFNRENTLNILNLEDEDSISFKKQNFINNNFEEKNLSQYKKSVKCLILSTIAKLSEYYGQVPDIRSASTDEERGAIFAKACRRPYCVKLESEIFESLILFINQFSESFFKIIDNNEVNNSINSKENESLNYLDSYCLLSTIKILKTNLICLSISKLDLKFFIKQKDNNPFLKVKEFIFKIIEIYNTKLYTYEKNNQNISNLGLKEKKIFDIIRALYEECKIILLKSADTLYPDNKDLIDIIEKEIKEFKTNNYSKDIVNSILEWMSGEENMKNLLLNLNRKDFNRIIEIFKTVSNWEVETFTKYIKNFNLANSTEEENKNNNFPKFKANNNDELIAFKFARTMQTEILKEISKKLLNENYDDIENELLLRNYSEIIFNNILNIFKNLMGFLYNLNYMLEENYNEIYNKKNSNNNNKKSEEYLMDDDDEEFIDTSFKPSKEINNNNEESNNNKENKEEISLEDFKKKKFKEIWDYFMNKILFENLLIMKIFTFHIESLAILGSNFIISSLMLNSLNDLLKEMNDIVNYLKSMDHNILLSEEFKEQNKEIVIESDHPYLPGQDKFYEINIPGESELLITFDPQCALQQNCAKLNFYKSETDMTLVFPQNKDICSANFPKEPLKVENAPIVMKFYSDNCANRGQWGFKITISGKKNSMVVSKDKFTDTMRSLNWVSCKFSAQLMRGIFIKNPSTGTGIDEEDIKYVNLLNSKLFAGGLEYDEIMKDNDKNISNVLNLLNDISPEKVNHNFEEKENKIPYILSEKNMLFKLINNEDESIKKVLEILQNKFSEKIIWAHLGGNKADRLVRAAFAALLRHSGKAKDFQEIVDLIEFKEEKEINNNNSNNNLTSGDKDENNNNKDNDINNIKEIIQKHPKFENIFKKWEAASRMRTWLIEKKKNVDEALEKNKSTNNNNNSKKENEESNNANNPNENRKNSLMENDNNNNNPSEENNSDAKNKIEENNSEEIMNKIIEQTIIKAKFLIKLNPSPIFMESNLISNKLNKNPLIRSSSLEEINSKENSDNWKLRLNQWKIIQQSKEVLHSVENESNEKLMSLTTSVLLTLQSTLSSKRLINKIKIASIRAKAREIGLNSLKNIFEFISCKSLIRDLLSWFCAAIRKSENKLCHYLDNLSGCGHNFESRIREKFHEFIIVLINKLMNVDDPIEIKSFIDALMWRYSSIDHEFLVNNSLFLILWGSYNPSIKNTWGKSLKKGFQLPEEKDNENSLEKKENNNNNENNNNKNSQKKDEKNNNSMKNDVEFTKDILEIFEILANICIEKALINQSEKQKNLEKANNQNNQNKGINIKFPNLEKQISVVDHNSSENLLTQILDVIFGECANALNSYLKYRGISYRLWLQFEKLEEEQKTTKNKKKNNEQRQPQRRYSDESYYEPEENEEHGESEEGEESEENETNNNIQSKEKEKKDKSKSEEKPYSLFPNDKIAIYEDLRFSNESNSNNFTEMKINEDDLINFVKKQNENIYDPDYLYRLLSILYKCSLQFQNEKILYNISNPLNLSTLFRLLRICSTQEKILIIKILNNICPNIPEEILIESLDMFLRDSEREKFILEFSNKRSNYDTFDKRVFIEFIIDLISDFRIKCWNNEYESTNSYPITSNLISLLRNLWENKNWTEQINSLVNDLLKFENFEKKKTSTDPLYKIKATIRKEIIIGIFGGEYIGLSTGAEVRVKTENKKEKLDLEFIKKDFIDQFSFGKICGFSKTMEALWKKQANAKEDKNKKQPDLKPVHLTPYNLDDCQICVLLNDSILKDEFNFNDLIPDIYNLNNVVVSQPKINFEKLEINKDQLEKMLRFVFKNDYEKLNENKNDNKIIEKDDLSCEINLRTNYLRFLEKFLQTRKGIELFGELNEEFLKNVLLKICEKSSEKITYGHKMLNLELLEEKRYRLLNYCIENKESLCELDTISAAYKKPNHLMLRLNNGIMVNISYNIAFVCNYDFLSKLTDFNSLGIDSRVFKEYNVEKINEKKNEENIIDKELSNKLNKHKYFICSFENLENYLNDSKNNKSIIICNIPSNDSKINEAKYKKFAHVGILFLEENSFKELISIYYRMAILGKNTSEIEIFDFLDDENKEKEEKVKEENKENNNEGNSNEENKENSEEEDLDFIKETIAEIKDFGFPIDLIKKEAMKMKDNFNLFDLIKNLLDLKEKKNETENFSQLDDNLNNEEEEEIPLGSYDVPNNPNLVIKEKTEEIKESKFEDMDDEEKNDCFNTKEDTKNYTPECFNELIIPENAENIYTYKTFKSLNEKIGILYSRRILLNILSSFISNNNKENNLNNDNSNEESKKNKEKILQNLDKKSIINVMKLLTNEGLFCNSINYGSDILLKMKNLLEKLFILSSNNSNSNANENITNNNHISSLTDLITKNTFSELESILEGKSQVYEFFNFEDNIINKPFLFFSIWTMMIMNEFCNEKVDYNYMFNCLSGVVMKINENKQIRWFLLDLLIQLTLKINMNLSKEICLKNSKKQKESIKNLENVKKLRLFLDDCINRETKKNLSKRSQMICELLIYLEELEKKIKEFSEENEGNQISELLKNNNKTDNFVMDLLTTFEMMKDFFDKKYLKYLAWIELNPDITNSSKINYESNHLYPKAPHTFLINQSNAISLDINISNDTLIDSEDSLLFSLDKNGNFPIESIGSKSTKKNFSLQSSHLFVNFPSHPMTEVYCFGSNSFKKFGLTLTDIYTPKLIDALAYMPIKDINIGEYTIVTTNNGELLYCGGSTSDTRNTFSKKLKNEEKIGSSGIQNVAICGNSVIAVTRDGSLFSIGNNVNGCLGQGWTNPVPEFTSMNFNKKIKQIALSDTHCLLLNTEGKVFHLGNNDYLQNGIHSTSRNNSPYLLNLDLTATCEGVSCGENFSIFIMRDKVTNRSLLYGSGKNADGRTGLDKSEEYTMFKQIPAFENDLNIEFKYVVSSKQSSAVITGNNKLYVWGNNSKGNLCLGHFSTVNSPTQVTFFDKFEVLDIKMSSDHTLVLVKDPEKNKNYVYSCGDCSNGMLGETITQKTEKKDCITTPVKISFFEGKNPIKIIAGPRCSMVICKPKSLSEVRDTHNVECSLCTKNPIIGNVYAEIFEENDNKNKLGFLAEDEIKFYCNSCEKISEMETKVPKILVKSPLREYNSIFIDLIKKEKNMIKLKSEEDEKEIDPKISEDFCANCRQCKSPINFEKTGGYQYLEYKNIYALCNNCIDAFPSCITSAKVYLRTFAKYRKIDITNTINYYENSISYGHKFSVTPVLNEKGSNSIIEKNINSFNNFTEEIFEHNKFEVYEQLVDLLNNISQKNEKEIFSYNPKDLIFKKEDLSVRSSLEKCSTDVLKKMFVILKIMNNRVSELLPFIDFSKVLQDNTRLSSHFNKITPLIFWDGKKAITKFYLDKTCAEYVCGEIKINRMKTRRFIEKGKTDHTGQFTIFGQIYQYLRTKSFNIFKKKEGGNNNKMFNAAFVGEASIDAGGPYREALCQACGELQSNILPLFIPSPNQKNESGIGREKWIVNPSAKTTTHLDMYKYFGGLIGYAMRTGEFLNLDLPSIFWKKLLDVQVDRKDLESIDRYTIQCLDDIININKKGVSESNFSFIVEQKFTTCLSDGTEVELMSEGKDVDVTYSNRVKYCELVEKIRLEESNLQIKAIQNGLEYVIPVGLMKMLSWKELETLVCGKPILDIELLRENTVYRGCSDADNHIKNLWKCLEEFSAEERSMYLRFVWGRSRLPLTSKDFSMKHRVELLHHNNPDVALPTSHTCFFSLEIPKYSNYEILKEKLKYAITHCQAIDTDGNAFEIWQDED